VFVSNFYLHFFCKVLFLYCLFCCVGSVITQIRKRTNASIHISKGNNDDLVEVIMIFSKVQIFSPSFALYSTSKSLVIVREDVLGDRGSVSARNPPPARSDHSGFTLPPFVSSVPEYASVDFDQRRDTGQSSLGMVSSDRFYGYESNHGLVSVGSILIWRFLFVFSNTCKN
ncbi:unnamed protein product, partial [Brassica rapa subsp. trilocularis]